jgi:hypothetical protein
MELHEVRALVQRWAESNPQSVIYDPAEDQLLDIPSGKVLRFDMGRVQGAHKKKNAQTGGSYVVLLRDDGVQLVLSEPGLAWAPWFVNSGHMEGLPEVVCWQDFFRSTQTIEHHLEHHKDEPPGEQTLIALMFCIALLDGARQLDFHIASEERNLERLLQQIEKLGQAGS